jgi:hypothetical protein
MGVFQTIDAPAVANATPEQFRIAKNVLRPTDGASRIAVEDWAGTLPGTGLHAEACRSLVQAPRLPHQ